MLTVCLPALLAVFACAANSNPDSAADGTSVTASPSGGGSAELNPPGPGRDLANSCIQCHGPDFMPMFKKSTSEWSMTIDGMVERYGPEMTQEDRDVLADYLASKFGPD
jgi:hypothetical protein